MENDLFVILGAGFGSRLLPYTQDVPKPLVTVCGSNLLSRTLKSAILAGIPRDNILIATGHCADAYLPYKLRTVFNPIYTKSNMLASLYFMDNFAKYERVIVHYGDTVFSPITLKNLVQSEEKNVVVSDKYFLNYWKKRSEDYINDLETFIQDEKNNLVTLGEPVSNISDLMGQFTGLIKFSGNELFQCLESARKKVMADIFLNWYMTDFIRYCINDQGINFKVIETCDPWIEVDTVEDLHSSITHSRLIQIDQALAFEVANSIE